jgi:hypothetical protein
VQDIIRLDAKLPLSSIQIKCGVLLEISMSSHVSTLLCAVLPLNRFFPISIIAVSYRATAPVKPLQRPFAGRASYKRTIARWSITSRRRSKSRLWRASQWTY